MIKNGCQWGLTLQKIYLANNNFIQKKKYFDIFVSVSFLHMASGAISHSHKFKLEVRVCLMMLLQKKKAGVKLKSNLWNMKVMGMEKFNKLIFV